MKPTKLEYTKTATSFEQQIDILKHRGVIITDEKKAKEILKFYTTVYCSIVTKE